MKKNYLLLAFAMFSTTLLQAQELPENPTPGKCYIKCITKDEFKEITETIQVSPSYKKLSAVPATYKTVEEKVLVKEAGRKTTIVPATYKTTEERVMVKEASKRQNMVAATYKTVEERMMVKEAAKKLVTYPATYKTVEERVMTKEASTKMTFKPATFKTVEDRVMVKEAMKTLSASPQTYTTETVSFQAKTGASSLSIIPATFAKETQTFVTKAKSGKWEYKTLANCPSANKEDCMTACYVETPEETETITITKLVSDANTNSVPCEQGSSKINCDANASYKKQVIANAGKVAESEIPAEYAIVKRQVLATPASYDEVTIPAEYSVVKKQVINTPARVEEVEIPAEYAVVKRQVVATPARVEEVEIPAEYAVVKHQVIDRQATSSDVEIPAEYATIKKQVVDRAASTTEETVPATSKTYTRMELVKKGGITVWEEVDCSLVGTNNLLNILYEYNSAKITPASARDIDDHLLKLMREKSNLRVEIMSHTDSRGNDDYNMSLSQQRAQSVVNYLVEKGISRDRLMARGYGETQLKNKCSNGVNCSEAQHQTNRRTEFRILN